MKSYTNLEQSKKLAEILPLESADMCFVNDGTAIKIDANSYNVRKLIWKNYVVEVIPCWSLTALLKMLKDYQLFSNGLIVYIDNDSYRIDSDNPVDACYEMILKLNEQKIL